MRSAASRSVIAGLAGLCIGAACTVCMGQVSAPTPRPIGDKTQPATNRPPPAPRSTAPATQTGQPGRGNRPGVSVVLNPQSFGGRDGWTVVRGDDGQYQYVRNRRGAGWPCTTFVEPEYGFRVRGAYADENFRLAFELNMASPAIVSCRPMGGGAGVMAAPLNWMDWYRWSAWRYYYFYDPMSDSWYGVGRDPVYGTLSRVDYGGADPFVSGGQPWSNGGPARTTAVVEVRKPLTLAEKGDVLLAGSDAKGAIDAYREYLARYDTDGDVMRRLAVALLADGKTSEAIAMMAMAYDTDPTLASRPLDAASIGHGATDLRNRANQAMTYATSNKTASSYLTVAVLMQADGRMDSARRVLQRAVEQGLEARIGDPLRAAMAAK